MRQRIGPTVSFAVTCTNEACASVNATGSVRVPTYRGRRARTVGLGSVTTSLAQGQREKLRLKLSTINRRLFLSALQAHKQLGATIVIVAKDAAGNRGTSALTVKLTR